MSLPQGKISSHNSMNLMGLLYKSRRKLKIVKDNSGLYGRKLTV